MHFKKSLEYNVIVKRPRKNIHFNTMWTYLRIWQSLFSMEMKTDDTYGTTIIYDYYFRKQG